MYQQTSSLFKTYQIKNIKQQVFNRFINLNKKIHQQAIITVAITGDVADKSRLKSIPLTTKEQIESIIECYDAGARLVHVHVRDPELKFQCTWKSTLYNEVMHGVKEKCPDIIFECSSGNYGETLEQRSEMLYLKPEMASLTTGSVNFRSTRPGILKEYINTNNCIDGLAKIMLEQNVKPDVAIFDLSHIYHAGDLVNRGLIKLPIKLLFVLGGHMALPAKKHLLQFMIDESINTFGGEQNIIWGSVGVGWSHTNVQRWTLELGGHPRTGYEDTLMIKRGVYAKNNAELVHHIAELCKETGRSIADGNSARSILNLPHQSDLQKWK